MIVEAPTYLGALAAARAQGLQPVPVPADERGVRPDLLADALQRSGARLVYLQPAFANPHGASLAVERRAEVLDAVRAAGAFLIEDDAVRDLAFGTAPAPLFGDDPDGHVVHVRSLTKPAAPGLRISALIARGPALARLRAARIVEDLYVPGPLQEAALDLVGTPAWRTGSRSATNVPRPGRASTSPRATSDASARCTVAGPARWRAISVRTDGSRSPGDAAATSASIAVTIVAVLPFDMSAASNAIAVPTVTQDALEPAAASPPSTHRDARRALIWGFVGVLAFSFSLPATRLAVADLDATFVGLGRALVAAALAALLLAWRRERLPARRDLPRFALVGLGVVVGFPIFTSLALKHTSSAHASVVVGLLPAATAAWAVARAGERPPRAFWLAAAAGLVAVLAFAATQGVGGIERADLLILAAVALGGLGYAEGGALSRRYGGWQVICWALVFTAPFIAIPVTIAASHGVHAGTDAWLGFAYVAVISMFLGFFAWYHGLALGGVAKIGQVQLAQPVLTLLWAALILGETITPWMLVAALAVLACVVATQRTRATGSST